jgi:hypothetical protein
MSHAKQLQMRIFQIPFSKVRTNENVLNWITSEEVKGGKNCERYWIVRTEIKFAGTEIDEAAFNLAAFLNIAHKNNYQSILITKNV